MPTDFEFNKEEFIELWPYFTPEQQRYWAKLAPQLDTIFAKAPEVLEGEGYEAWIKHYFGTSFSRPFTKYQAAFWEWGWEIQPDTYYRPRIECAPRGAGKSTTAETWLVSVLARKRRQTIGYVSGTSDKATQHFNSVRRKLENSDLLHAYPHLKPKVQKYRNAFNSWSQDRLVTDGGQTIIPITLHGSNRGFKSEDDVRFDLLILDDIDSLGESPDVIAKNLDILKSEIIFAGYANTLTVFFQNLIHRDSICSMIMDHRADILSDREFKGPYPLMKWYDADKIELPDGGQRWVITAGEEYDPALPIPYCESILNQIGKDLFDREGQQDVTKVAEDKDFREWDEIFHIITFAEMAEGFWRSGKVKLKDANGYFIPNRWHVGRGFDWGSTRGHPSAIAHVTRPDQTCPFDDAHFMIAETVLPRFPFDPSLPAEVVSPGRVVEAMKNRESQLRVRDSQVEQSKMSHEASAALNTILIDLPERLQTFFRKWKAQKGSGVPQIQNLLEIDRTKPHPFRRYPVGHKKAGEPITGRPRIFFVVADGQGELYCNGDNKLRVRGATDSRGLARARYEMPLYSFRNSGEKKLDDDFVDALRGLMSTFGVHADQKTQSEREREALPPKYREIAEQSAKGGLTPAQEMSLNFQMARAKQKVKSGVRQWDWAGNEIGDSDTEM